MKQLKIFSCAVVAAFVLAIPVGIASATTATTLDLKGNPVVYTGEIYAPSGSLELHGPITVTCENARLASQIESHGTGVTAAAKVSTLDFELCSSPVTVLKAGSLEFHATSGGFATVTSSGAEIQVDNTSLGINCVYTTSSTDIGSFGHFGGGSFPYISFNSAVIPRTGGSFFCGSSAVLTGGFSITTPSHLSFH